MRTNLKRGIAPLAAIALASGIAIGPTSAASNGRHVVDTFRHSDGTVCCFGGENRHITAQMQTAGQTFKVPVHSSYLRSFAIRLYADRGLAYRAYVYKWNPGKLHAVGDALWRSKVIEGKPREPRIKFDLGQLQVRPGKRYVFFISVSEIIRHQGRAASYEISPGKKYQNGRSFGMHNRYHPRRWTHSAWPVNPGQDFAFRAVFSK